MLLYKSQRNQNLQRDALFSGWTMYGAFAGICMIQGNTILLNIYFGPLANTAFGIANNIYNAFNSLANSIVLAFRPRMIKTYAAKIIQIYPNFLQQTTNLSSPC